MENLFSPGAQRLTRTVSATASIRWLLSALWLLLCTQLYAQNYYGIQGSNYAGSLGTGNNPASIVNTPYKWDVDIFSFQAKNATNGITLHNYSLFSSPDKATATANQGYYRRFGYADFNVNLLNTRISVNRKQAFAFGINLRGYAQGSSSPFNFIDSLKTTANFFDLGNYANKLYGDMLHSSWVEIYASWGQTILDNYSSRLNAGITAKVSRGISGAYTRVQNGTVSQTVHGNRYVYTLQDVLGEYGYSSNYDGWNKQQSTSQNLRNFVNDTRGGFSFDLGVEYLIKPQQIATVFDEDSYYDYDWKIGVSILDIGFNQYKYGKESRRLSGFQNNITDTVVDQRFLNVKSVEAFNDSLVGVIRNIQQPTGLFNIVNPARLVINVDRYLFDAFYVNGNLSVNLSSLSGHQWRLTELNLLTITPRWETHRVGVYMPVQFNNKKQFWVGGAFKYGPLLVGVHNWATIFAKNKMQNGGAYVALVLHAWKSTRTKTDKRLDCPRN
jgi:hypothetical protein